MAAKYRQVLDLHVEESWRDINMIPWQALSVSIEIALLFLILGKALGSPPTCPPTVEAYVLERPDWRLNREASMSVGVTGPFTRSSFPIIFAYLSSFALSMIVLPSCGIL